MKDYSMRICLAQINTTAGDIKVGGPVELRREILAQIKLEL